MESNTSLFQKAVNRAEQLGRLAREVAGESIQASLEAISRAEQISEAAIKAAEAARRESQEAVSKAEQISKAAMAMKITDLLSILVTLVFCLAVFNGVYSNREILRYY